MQTKAKKRPWLKGCLVGAVVLLAAGSLYQRFGQAADLRRHPPAGILVDAGGFRLHLNCAGTGSPTVIAEAGGADFSIIWRHVQRAVARQTRFCSYDRSGFGWSEYSGEIPTRERVSAELRAALTSAGIDGSLIMLGHSLGGVYVRDYALRHPQDVAGIILLDSSHENQLLRLPESRPGKAMQAMMSVCSALTWTGILRATRFWQLTTRDMSEEASVAYLVTRGRTEFCGAMRDTLAAFDDVMGLNQPPRSLGDVPLIVLSHDASIVGRPGTEERERIWSELQEELAALSTDSTHRVIDGASHIIQVDDPQAVIDAVLEMVGKVRSVNQSGSLSESQ